MLKNQKNKSIVVVYQFLMDLLMLDKIKVDSNFEMRRIWLLNLYSLVTVVICSGFILTRFMGIGSIYFYGNILAIIFGLALLITIRKVKQINLVINIILASSLFIMIFTVLFNEENFVWYLLFLSLVIFLKGKEKAYWWSILILVLPIGITLLKIFNVLDVPNISIDSIVSLIICMIFYLIINSLYNDFSEKYLNDLRASQNALSKTIEELSSTNRSFQNEIVLRKKAEEDLMENNVKLEDANKELSLLNKFMVDREMKMVALKAEINNAKNKV